MKKLTFLILMSLLTIGLHAQNLEVEGKAKITVMDRDDTVDSVVVRLTDGTLAVRDVSSLPDADSTNELQILRTNGDTIFISYGNFVVIEGISLLSICFKPNKTVQERLKCGETPLEIFTSGIPVDSLYGKTFAGGLIFYVDTSDIYPFEGLVSAPPPDQSGGIQWYNGSFIVTNAAGTGIGTG